MIIYKTTNLINNKIYIGQDVNNNPNYYGSGKILKQAIKKNGKENFEKVILEKCASKEELNEREIYWIKKLDATNPEIGYNLAFGGNTCSIYDLPIELQIKWKINNKIAMKKRGQRILSGNLTEKELENYKKLGKNKKERIKKLGFSEKEKLGYYKLSQRRKAKNFTKEEVNGYKKLSERRLSGNFTDKEILKYKNDSIKKSGNGNPSWKGYVYIYNKNNELIHKFNTIKDAYKFLHIHQYTLKKILKEKYLDLNKYITRTKNKLLYLNGCKFIKSKKNIDG